MFVRTFPMVRPLLLAAFAAAVFFLGRGVARADEVFIQGYTNGCFNCASPVNSASSQTAVFVPGASGARLFFGNSTFFGGDTSGGSLTIQGDPLVNDSFHANFNNLGALSLGTGAFDYGGNSFTLRVSFFRPVGIDGPNTQLLAATLTGSVTSQSDGSVLVHFLGGPITFVFSNLAARGSFTFQVDDLTLHPGELAAISGRITSAQQTSVPEPATLILLGTGLAGVAAGVRPRRASKC
jgi:hypothetical protein